MKRKKVITVITAAFAILLLFITVAYMRGVCIPLCNTEATLNFATGLAFVCFGILYSIPTLAILQEIWEE